LLGEDHRRRVAPAPRLQLMLNNLLVLDLLYVKVVAVGQWDPCNTIALISAQQRIRHQGRDPTRIVLE